MQKVIDIDYIDSDDSKLQWDGLDNGIQCDDGNWLRNSVYYDSVQ